MSSPSYSPALMSSRNCRPLGGALILSCQGARLLCPYYTAARPGISIGKVHKHFTNFKDFFVQYD